MPNSAWQAAILASSLIAAIGALAIRWRGGLALETRKGVRVFFVAWLAIFLVEYAFGPSSFIFMDDEGDYAIPIINYLVHFHDGGQFAHALGGGVDRWAAFVVGVHNFSPELALFARVPTWVGIFLLKAAVASAWFVGSYRLARAGGGRRSTSAAIAALAPLTQLEFYDHTTWNGLGFALMPLLTWLGPGRAGRRRRMLSLAAIAILAAFSDPTHTAKAMAAAIVTGGIVLRRSFWSGTVLPVLAAAMGMAANTTESLYAMAQIAPLSFRGRSGVEVAQLGQNGFDFGSIMSLPVTNPTAFATVVLAIMMSAAAGRRWQAIRLALAMAFLSASTIGLLALPWDRLGLAVVGGVGTGYIVQAVIVVAILGAAQGDNAWARLTVGTRSLPLRHLTATLIISVAAGAMASIKGEHIKLWIMDGAQAQYHTIENLATPDWAPHKPFRVVTLRNRRPEPNLAFGFYGLHTLDGSLNMVPDVLTRFWFTGVLRGAPLGKINYLSLDWKYYWCCDGQYDIAAQADLDLLRVANVGYLISPVPVRGLAAVSAPPRPPIVTITSSEERRAYYTQALARLRSHGPVYVYALGEPLPRVFTARAVHHLPADTGEVAFLREISARALNRVAVVRGATLATPALMDTLNIERYELVRDGFDITVSAPHGGIVMVNTSYQPFWHLQIDGVAGQPVPANFIHMAIQVPPGARQITLRYCRPSLMARACA